MIDLKLAHAHHRELYMDRVAESKMNPMVVQVRVHVMVGDKISRFLFLSENLTMSKRCPGRIGKPRNQFTEICHGIDYSFGEQR